MRKTGLVGVVLAGGLSSRLGHDKARIRLAGGENADLLARTAELLRPLTDEVLVVGRQQSGYACVPDKEPGLGPVGGIYTALYAAEGAACLVLSCDLTFMEGTLLERLLRARDSRPSGIHMTAYRQAETGHMESLVAVYEPESLPCFADCVRRKLLKISLVVPAEEQLHIPYAAQDSLPFFNINYPADLEVARRILQTLGRHDASGGQGLRPWNPAGD